jgi:hypothetical protein
MITLIRTNAGPSITRGVLVYTSPGSNPVTFDTLELPWMSNRRGVSCVPDGRYKLVFEYSPRFRRKLWELKNVPGRSEIKIHPANHTGQLHGCIALGEWVGGVLTSSRDAVERFHDLLKEPGDKYINIVTVF